MNERLEWPPTHDKLDYNGERKHPLTPTPLSARSSVTAPNNQEEKSCFILGTFANSARPNVTNIFVAKNNI